MSQGNSRQIAAVSEKTIALKFSSILGGISPLYHVTGENQYLTAMGIDPELSSNSIAKPLGIIMPSCYTKFSGSLLDSAPMWILGSQTTTGVFVYGANGTVIAYNASFSNETALGTATGTTSTGAGNGMESYNDYMYFSTPDDIVRYGRLSQTGPTGLATSYWVSGLGMSALTNADTPGSRNITYPNHPLKAHTDGRLYIGDYDGANGRIHSLITDNIGTNASGAFAGSGAAGTLTLPPGLIPMDIDSYGTDLAILCTSAGNFSAGSTPRPGSSALLLWDTIAPNFYRQIPITEPLATALINKNGELYVVCGNLDAGAKLLKYLGAYSFQTEAILPEGSPCPAGAADSTGDMVVWGSNQTYPTAGAGVSSFGYRNGQLGGKALHHIARISNTADSLPVVSAVRFLKRSAYPIIGWRTDTTANYGLDTRAGSGQYSAVIRSEVFNIGRHFKISGLKIPISSSLSAGMAIVPKIFIDNEINSQTLDTINTTNYPGTNRIIDVPGIAIEGYANAFLELTFNGTVEVGVLPGSEMIAEIYDH